MIVVAGELVGRGIPTLSFKQPWLYACVHLGKVLDNRRRRDERMPMICYHRGTLLMHASKSETADYYNSACAWMVEHVALNLNLKNRDKLPRGGVCAVTRVIAHVDPQHRAWKKTSENPSVFERAYELETDPVLQWQMDGSWGIVLSETKEIPFVPWKGRQGVFEVLSPEVLTSLHNMGWKL